MNDQFDTTTVPLEASPASRYARPESKPQGFVDKRAVAGFLGFTPRYIELLMARHGLPYMAIGRRRCRFDLEEVATWAKREFGVRRMGSSRQRPAHGQRFQD